MPRLSWLFLRLGQGQGGQFHLVPSLAVGGEQPFQFLEPPPLPGEPVRDHGHGLRRAADSVVDVRGEGPALLGDLLQLPYQERLSDTGVAVHVEEEAAPLVLDGQVEVGAKRGPFGVPADEALTGAPPDQLLHRRNRRLRAPHAYPSGRPRFSTVFRHRRLSLWSNAPKITWGRSMPAHIVDHGARIVQQHHRLRYEPAVRPPCPRHGHHVQGRGPHLTSSPS